MRSEVTPDVSQAVDGGSVFPGVRAAEGELGLAFLRRGRVLRNKLHDVRVLFVAADAAFADDMHDAGEHVSGAAAEPPAARRLRRFLLLTRVQHLKKDALRPAGVLIVSQEFQSLTLKTRLSMCISFSCFIM